MNVTDIITGHHIIYYVNKAKPSVYAMAIDRPPSLPVPYLTTIILTSSLDTTSRLLCALY
jgi:hypothetical protein